MVPQTGGASASPQDHTREMFARSPPVRAVALADYITMQLSAATALRFEGSVRLA